MPLSSFDQAALLVDRRRWCGLRMVDIGIGNGEWVGLEWQKGGTRHGEECALACRPTEMIRPAEGEANEAGSGDFGFGVEGPEAGLEAEVRMVEDDNADSADKSVEAPKEERRPHELVISGEDLISWESG